MKKPPPPSFFVTLPWSFAACGMFIAVGNLIGLSHRPVSLVPPVENLPGLLASSLFLFGCGLLAHLLRPSSGRRS